MIRVFIFLPQLLALIFSLSGCSGDNLEKKEAKENLDFEGLVDQLMISEKLSPLNYVKWVEDKNNGLKVEKKIGEFTYSLLYKPLEFVALMDIKNDSVNKEELKSKMNEYEELQYFTFRISTDGNAELLRKNLENKTEYYGRIQYFSFEMQKDLKLIDGKDTLDCSLFHFERVYGLAPQATFVLGFPSTSNLNDKTLFYDEKIFGSGKMYLKVHGKNIKKIPTVILQ